MNTTLLPTTPLSPFERLNAMMEDMFPTPNLLLPRAWNPPVDIKETEKEFVFLAELPGMIRENIEVELVGDTLLIKGKRLDEKDEHKENWVRKERFYGEFKRTFRLDVPVKADKIVAEYKDGLLKVVLPKIDAELPKRVNIKV